VVIAREEGRQPRSIAERAADHHRRNAHLEQLPPILPGDEGIGGIAVVDLPALSLAAFLAVGLAFPALISILGTAFEGSFILLIIALTSFWILLLDLRAEPKRLETEGAQS